MAKHKAAVTTPAFYLAIIFIGGGSSWGQAGTVEEAAKIARDCCERDWSSLFDLESRLTDIHIFDITTTPNWFADHRGVWAQGFKSEKPIPRLKKLTVQLKNRKQKRA